MDKTAALEKLKKYCAYQERCHQEVRTKLINLKIYGDTLEEIIVELVNENYLNEERFARSYARGKHNIKLWGRNKITQELKKRRVSAYCIRKAMTEIDEVDYQENLHKVLDKYIRLRTDRYPPTELKHKSLLHAVNKGYEYHMVKEALKDHTE